jgi:integration host factor subunit beta
VNAFLKKVIETLSQGDRLEFREFGVFEVVTRKERIGRNPREASKSITIPKKNTVKFTPGSHMKKMTALDE